MRPLVGRNHTRPGGAPDGRSGSQTSAPSKRDFLGSDDLGWSLKIRDYVQDGRLRVKYVNTKQNLGGFFTKALLRKDFCEQRSLVMNNLLNNETKLP